MLGNASGGRRSKPLVRIGLAVSLVALALTVLVTSTLTNDVGAAPNCPVAGTSNWTQIDLDPASAGCTLTLPGDIAYVSRNTPVDGNQVATTSNLDVTIPPGATVVASFLLWGGGSKWAGGQADLEAQTIKFGPAGGPTTTLNGQTAGAVAGNNGAYFKLADITDFMKTQFPTDQDINNDPDHSGTKTFQADGWKCSNLWLGMDCGWQIATIWALPDAPLRSVAFYFGGDFTFGYNPQIYFEVDSLMLPPGVTPDVRLYNTAHDADGPTLTAGGGRTSMKIGLQTDPTSTAGQGDLACPRNPQGQAAPAMYQNLTDPTPPADWRHVRLSEYENAGTAVGTTVGYPNGSPKFSDLCVNLDGNYLNWDWSSTFAVSARVFEPAFEGSEKLVSNCGPDPASAACVPMPGVESAHARPGDVLEYTINVENRGPARGGPDGPVDDADDVFVRDLAPEGTVYVAGSIRIDNDGDGTFETTPSDGPNDDQAEAGTLSDPALGTITGLTARLGAGAGTASDPICYNGFVPPTYPDPYPIDPAKAGDPVPLDACGGGRMTPGSTASVKFRVRIPTDGTLPQETGTEGAELPGMILDNDFQVAAVARTPGARVFRRFSDFDPQNTVGKTTDENLGVVVDGVTNVRVEKESDITPDPDFATPADDEVNDDYISGNVVEWTITLDNDDSTPPDVGAASAGSPSPTPPIDFHDVLPDGSVIDYSTLRWSCAVVETGVVYPDLNAGASGSQSLPEPYPPVDYNTSCGDIPAGVSAVTATGGTVTGTGLRLASQGAVRITLRARLVTDVPVGSDQLTNQAEAAFGSYVTLAGYEQPDSVETGDGLADNVDTETDNVVRAGNLTVTKGDDKSSTAYITPSPNSPVIAGNQITYEIRVRNPLLTAVDNGDNPNLQTDNADGSPLRPSTLHPRVLDALPSNLLSTPAPTWTCTASGTGSSCGAASGTGAVNDAPTIAAQGEIVYRITATVDPDAPDVSNSELQNRVTATMPAGEVDLDASDNTALDVDDIVKVTDLSITKDDGLTTVTAGGTSVTYTIDVRNDGSSTANGVAIIDDVPTDLTDVTWNCTPIGAGVCDTPSGTGPVGTSATIPGGAGVRIQVTGTVAPSATGSGTGAGGAVCAAGSRKLCNTASLVVPPDSTDVDATDNSASDVDEIVTTFDLAIDKTRPEDLVPGTAGRYVLTVSNNGPSSAAGFDITDALPAGMTLVNAAGTGWDCSDSGPDAVGCTFPGQLPPGASATVTVDVDTDADMAIAPVTNTATVAHPVDTDSSNNTASDTTTPQPSADLSIAKEQRDPIVAGETVRYRLTVSNNGPSTSTGVFVEDALPATLTYQGFTSVTPGWTCTPGAPIRCDLAPGIDPGPGTAAVVEITALAEETASGDVTNEASVGSDIADPDSANNITSVTGPTERRADLVMAKTAVGPFVAGESGTYELAVSNDGPSNAEQLVVTDPIPAGLALASADGDGWTCSEAPAGVLRCTRDSLATGTAPVITARFDIDAALRGTVTNRAAVSSTTPDPGTGNDVDTERTELRYENDVAIAKTASGTLVPGSPFTWKIKVTNGGPSTARDVTVSDTLPAGATVVSVGGFPASCDHGATSFECTIEALDPGADSVITLVAAVSPTLTASITNRATVTARDDTVDTNNASSAGPTAPSPSADLAIGKYHDPLVAGAVGTWTVAVSNLGPSAAADIAVTDVLPANVTPVSASGAGFTCSGSTEPTCRYDRVLLPGRQAVLTVRALVDAGATGSITNVASHESATADPVGANNTVSDKGSISIESVVSVSDTVLTPGPVRPGDTVTWSVAYRNLGTSNTGAAKMTFELSPGQTISDVRIVSQGTSTDGSATSWTGAWACTQSGTTVTCTTEDFPPGYEATFEVDSLVTSAENTMLTSSVSGTADNASGAADATASIAVEPKPLVTTTTTPATTTTTAAPGTSTTTTAPTGATVTTQPAQVAGAVQVYAATTGKNALAATGTSPKVPLLVGLTLVAAGLFLVGRRRRRE